MMQTNQHNPFSVYVPITKAYDSQDGKRWVFEAPLSDPSKDLQDERMNVAGLKKGLKVFKQLDMPVDWDHLWERSREPRWLIGKGMELYDAPHPVTGTQVPWVRGVLFKNKEIARQAKEHYDACQEEGGGGLGISVAGQVVRRDALDKSHILESIITSIALTPVPVASKNAGTVSFMKCMAASSEALSKGVLSFAECQFPHVPELYSRLVPAWASYTGAPGLDVERHLQEMRKAMESTGALPHTGPGANALTVSDLDDDDEERRLRQLDGLKPEEARLKKAFDQMMAGRLRYYAGLSAL